MTIGNGHAIFQPQGTHRLPSVRRDTGAPATQAEIDKDYNAVFGITNHKASYFASLTELELSQADIDSLLQTDFTKHIKIADAFFPLDQLPQPVQIALFDLAFQVGGNLTFREYPNLHPALSRRDWARAGAEMDVNHPIVDTRRNLARLTEASKALAFDFFFTTDPAKSEPLLDHLMKL